MRPDSNASRPAVTAWRMARAIRAGSSARETELARSTPSQPASIASAASDAVPIPASTITGTSARSTISRRLYGLRMPMPLPIGDPSGITAAQPASSRRRPVPRMRPEPTSRPAILRGPASATLHRLEDLHALSLAQLELVPLAARDHLAVDRHGHAAAFGLGAAGGHHVEHARVLAQLTRFAVQAPPHPRLP